MPAHNGDFVTWGRYDAEHQETMRRLVEIEGISAELRDSMSQYEILKDRVAGLEQAYQRDKAGSQTRKERLFTIMGFALIGLVFPLIYTGILTVIHLRSH